MNGAELTLRGLEIGDVGWAISRQAAIYAQERGWNAEFEALLCQIGQQFLATFDPERETGVVAVDAAGAILGTAFVQRGEEAGEAKLRMVYVEPRARGQGVGGRLVEAAMAFASERGYAKLSLWTDDALHAARRLYERAGFTLERSEPHHSFGHDLVGQYWSTALPARAP
jgi:GNAT superfamily N-acetyltransferase